MERSTFLILVSLIMAVITIMVGTSFWVEISSESEKIQFLPRITDISTVVVSDRVPLGCFIPPNITEEQFNKLKKELDKELFEFCFKYDGKTLNWNDIKDKLKYGLKVDGYCYSPKYASCMGLSEIKDDVSNRRSIDFGREAGWRTGYSYITGQPSIIVVKAGEEAHISLYGSAYFKKTVIDSITARVLNSTHPLLSCQGDCSDEYGECKRLENLLGIFQNCKEKFNNCGEGCEYADNHIEKLSDCPAGNKYNGCSKYYIYLSKQPSTKLLKIEGPIRPNNYTIVNLGDINLSNFRGLLWGSQTITFKQPANNCYNPIRYECYYNCREDKKCEEDKEECELENKKDCELECSCSTDIKMDSENTFVICRNFCISKDGYYEDKEKINNCVNGCEWASRGNELKSDITEFKTGYNKYLDFVSNSVPSNTYILKKLPPIFSSIVYIVDWDSLSSNWTYPSGGDYNILKTPNINKFITTNSAVEEIVNHIH